MSTAALGGRSLQPVVRGVARRIADATIPARRASRNQWRRIGREMRQAQDVVQAGPFEGMRLGRTTTGSHVPKRLGSYEEELHPFIEALIARGYDGIVDVGCGEGFYVVGLALRIPRAEVLGFDISVEAQAACVEAAALNDVGERVSVYGECSPEFLVECEYGTPLVIVDIEGAEVDLLTPSVVDALERADLLVELHDFAAPGASDLLMERLIRTHDVTFVEQTPRLPTQHAMLSQLSPDDAERAVNESRHPDQRWLVALSKARTNAMTRGTAH